MTLSGFRTKNWITVLLLLIILPVMMRFAQKYFVGLFFIPDSLIWSTPRDHGVDYEEVFFHSANGNKLNGFFLKPAGPPAGTIVHCHGNAGNITSHYEVVLFLVEAGYNVFCFDYSGYGKSNGEPTHNGITQDALGAVAYVESRPDVDRERIALFGQSLGGAAAAGAMAKNKHIRCLLLEGTFTTFRDMAWATGLGRMLFFITPFVIPNTGPVKNLKDIAPRPILILHGTDDEMIPIKFAHKLYKKASHKKSLSLIQGLHHLHGEEVDTEYQKVVLEFFDQNLKP